MAGKCCRTVRAFGQLGALARRTQLHFPVTEHVSLPADHSEHDPCESLEGGGCACVLARGQLVIQGFAVHVVRLEFRSCASMHLYIDVFRCGGGCFSRCTCACCEAAAAEYGLTEAEMEAVTLCPAAAD